MSKTTKTEVEYLCKCGERFIWDNGIDLYKTINGENCTQRKILNEQTSENEKGITVIMFQCPKCKAILGFMHHFGYKLYPM